MIKHRRYFSYSIAIFLLLGSIYLIVACFDAVKVIAAWDWPQTTGIIVSSTVESETDSSGEKIYFAKIRYRYSVNEETFTGGRISYTEYFSDSGKDDQPQGIANKIVGFFGRRTPASYGDYVRSTAAYLCKQYPLLQKVDVYYNPENPSESFLEQGGIAGRALLRSFIFFFLAGLIMFFKWLWRSIKAS